MRSLNTILNDIDDFRPFDGNWLKLDELVIELWETGKAQNAIHSLFQVFERFSEDDGAGVFWSILHGLESLDYEESLYKSLVNKPSLMTIIMLKRIEKTNAGELAGKSILRLKEIIRNNPKTAPELLIDFD